MLNIRLGAKLRARGLAILLALTLGCSIDERNVTSDVRANLGVDAGDGRPGGGSDAGGEGGARFELSPTYLEFGSAVVGFVAFRRVIVRSRGDAPITGLTVALSDDGDPDLRIVLNQCPPELAAGESCDVRIQFLPREVGEASGVLHVTSAEQQGVVSLSGTGLTPGDLLLLPVEGSSADFGGVTLGASTIAEFRIDNPKESASGILSLDLANPAFVLQPPAQGECQPGLTSLAGGEGCNLRVAFEPTEAGLNEATLTAISTNLGAVSLGLRGDGLAPARLVLRPGAHDFGGVVLGGTGRATVSVENGGDLPLELSLVQLDPASDAAFTIVARDCGPGTVLGGQAGLPACSVELEFRPTLIDVAMGALTVSAGGGLTGTVTLRGEGLLPGTLMITPEGGGSASFGDVLVGESLTQRFIVSNPDAEPSGTLEVSGSGDFEPLAPEAADECVSGATALAQGESCAVNVRLTASARGPLSGALTVSSALAGSVRLPLDARGLLPGTLVIDRDQIDFGRVVRGTSVEAVLTVRNEGDVELPAPASSLGTATSGDASAFSASSDCPAALAPGEECDVTLTFAPEQSTAYSVTLDLASDSGSSGSVLLVARVIEPGSLVVTPASGSSANFGDVAINTTVAGQFVLTNPGGEPSGRITLSSNDARFSPSAGDCNSLGAAGLIDGASCTFSVSFTPNSAETLSASVTVTSVGAGDTALPLTGRGRNAARLGGSNDFNFNTVIQGESATARTWTVTNDGDLPTGTLTTTGANSEFTVASNNCAGRSLAGGQSCTMLVGFTPQGSGVRSGAISVGDGTLSVTLTVRGAGQALPGVGSACLDGRCAGTASCENHSNGQSLVCCAQNCTGNQRCSEARDFEACELPSVGQGQGCGASVLCEAGLTCNASTGTCCVSSCTGPCRFCNVNGTCGSVADGQPGTCASGQVCAGGTCGECTPFDLRCSPSSSRTPQQCSSSGVWQNQAICQFVCSGGFCGGECTPNSIRCDPVTGRPQLCSAQGAWQTQAACGAGSVCSGGTCVCSTGFDSCQNQCVDLDTSASHCGACGRSCFPAQGGTCAAGSCAATPIATGETAPVDVQLTGTHAYWTTGSNVIRRVPKAGGSVTTVFTGQSNIAGGLSNLLIAGNQLYFANSTSEGGGIADRVMRTNLDGMSPTAFSPAYINTNDDSVDHVAASDTVVWHAVLHFDAQTTTLFRAPILSQGQAGAGVQTDMGLIQGRLRAVTAVGNCLFYTTEQTINQIIRKCTAAAGTLHHLGQGNVSFRRTRSSDGTNIFFTDNNGLASIGVAAGAQDVPLTNVNPGSPTVDAFDNTALWYFAQTGSFGAPACTTAHTLFRAGRTIGSGNPVAILPPPHQCPTQVAVDSDALYWANAEGGTIMKVGK